MDLKAELYPKQVVFMENADTMSEVAAQNAQQGRQSLCFLRGLPKEIFTGKLLCAAADVAWEKAERGTCSAAEWGRLMAAANFLCGNVRIDSAAMGDEEILAQCKRLPSADVILILSLAK